VEITAEKLNQKLLNKVPRTAAGFEQDYNSLKKDMPTFYAYLKNIPADTISQLFKTVEVPAELFAAILKTLADFGLQDEEGLKHASALMAAMGKASSFDMTLMFMDSKEKKDLVSIVQSLKKNADKLDKEIMRQVDTIYKI
jgi:hypothetical protein